MWRSSVLHSILVDGRSFTGPFLCEIARKAPLLPIFGETVSDIVYEQHYLLYKASTRIMYYAQLLQCFFQWQQQPLKNLLATESRITPWVSISARERK